MPTTDSTCPSCGNDRAQWPVLSLPHGTATTVCAAPDWHYCSTPGCTRPWGHPWGKHTAV